MQNKDSEREAARKFSRDLVALLRKKNLSLSLADELEAILDKLVELDDGGDTATFCLKRDTLLAKIKGLHPNLIKIKRKTKYSDEWELNV